MRRLLIPPALTALLAACAAPTIDANLAAARADVQARAQLDFRWLTDDAARAQARAEVDAALRQPLDADAAVRLALAASPALQAALFERAADSARATQSARLSNPVLEFERLAGGSPAALELTRGLALSALDLALLPARARAADAAQRRLRLELALDALRAAQAAREAWIAAVSARAEAAQARRGLDAAEAAAALAGRLEAAGSFSALQRAREEAGAGEAVVELARARRAERAGRAALVRALGLDAAQAAALQLPDHLPAPPQAAPAAADEASLQSTLAQRLDLLIARARLEELAPAKDAAAIGRALDGLTLAAVRKTQTGLPDERGARVGVPLPVFDIGDAARAEASARLGAAFVRAEGLAADAAAQLRDARDQLADDWAVARRLQEELVPLRTAIADEDLRRYDGMLASPFELLADAREQARAVRAAIAAQRDFWRADAAWRAAALGLPAGRDPLDDAASAETR